jgi:hypothetical protein
MWLAPAGVVILLVFFVGLTLGQDHWTVDLIALWTGVLAVVTTLSVYLSARYQRLVHEQLELQKEQFADYLRPLLVWDQCVPFAGGRAEIVVRNVGRTTATVRASSPTLISNGSLVPVSPGRGWEVITEDRRVCPQCAVYVATLPDDAQGTVSVPYIGTLDTPGSPYMLSDLVTDMLASCHRRGPGNDL